MVFFTTRNFYKSNANNLAIASTNSGVGTPTDELSIPVTLTGTISTTSGNTAVVGVGTLFTTELAVGNFLYNASNVYLGRVATITDNLNLVLETGGAYVTAAAISFKKATTTGNSLNGDLLVRIGVVYVNPTTVNIPKISQLRNPNGPLVSDYTDTAFIAFSKESTAGTMGTSITPVNIPLTIERLNIFTQSSLPTGNYFPTSGDLPSYIWYKLNPYGNLGTLLDVSTRFNLLFAESLPEIALTTSMSYSLINNGDY